MLSCRSVNFRGSNGGLIGGDKKRACNGWSNKWAGKNRKILPCKLSRVASLLVGVTVVRSGAFDRRFWQRPPQEGDTVVGFFNQT